MSQKFPERLESARRTSLKSKARMRLGASIFKSGRLLASCCNNRANKKETKGRVEHHAEVRALRFVQRRTDVDTHGATIYIYRTSFLGPATAKPCKECQEELKRAGIRKIVYTISNPPFFEVWKVNG